MRQPGPVGRHRVDAFDDPERHDIVIRALVPENPHRFHRQEDRERLPDLPIEAGLHHLVLQHGVGVAEDLEVGRGDVAHHAHAEAGAGERLPPDDFLGHAQFFAEQPDFVLEQIAQRLN